MKVDGQRFALKHEALTLTIGELTTEKESSECIDCSSQTLFWAKGKNNEIK